MKRMVVAVTVADDTADADLALEVACHLGSEADPTAWEWDNFWTDYSEGVVGPEGDSTTKDTHFHDRH